MTTGTIPVTKLRPTPHKLHVFGQKQAVQKAQELLLKMYILFFFTLLCAIATTYIYIYTHKFMCVCICFRLHCCHTRRIRACLGLGNPEYSLRISIVYQLNILRFDTCFDVL